MNFLLDENVSLGLAHILRERGHNVVMIAEITNRGVSDRDVWLLAQQSSSILVTRDYHFTNPTRFHPEEIGAIIFIRHGNLTAQEEISLVLKFIEQKPSNMYHGKLVTISKLGVKIR